MGEETAGPESGEIKSAQPSDQTSLEIALLDLECLALSIYIIIVARWRKNPIRSFSSDREAKKRSHSVSTRARTYFLRRVIILAVFAFGGKDQRNELTQGGA